MITPEAEKNENPSQSTGQVKQVAWRSTEVLEIGEAAVMTASCCHAMSPWRQRDKEEKHVCAEPVFQFEQN